MIKNYLKSAIRSFQKNKVFSVLNVTGLALGIAASLMIMQYVRYERSYDTFNTHAERIYRIQYNSYQNGKVNFECAAAVPAAGPAMKKNFPQVVEQVRLYPTSGVLSYNDPVRGLVTSREVNNIQITEPSVFNIFNLELISGNPETCIDAGGKMAISQKAANKYFGDEDPMGKTLTIDGYRDFEIRAVFADLPDNSHIKFDFLVNHAMFDSWVGDWDWENSWGWYDHNTYVLLQEGTDPNAIHTGGYWRDLQELPSKFENLRRLRQ